jgi:hypothetical protein
MHKEKWERRRSFKIVNFILHEILFSDYQVILGLAEDSFHKTTVKLITIYMAVRLAIILYNFSCDSNLALTFMAVFVLPVI